MPALTVKNVPDAVHQTILDTAVQPPERVKLGTLLFEMGREIGLTEEEHAAIFGNLRDKTPARPMGFE